ncbi:MAG: hypothetical protein JXQ73_28770 [Phycisphaerae bacterium]|nr:hypothetical protein [Phycisphaerae bacterium]
MRRVDLRLSIMLCLVSAYSCGRHRAAASPPASSPNAMTVGTCRDRSDRLIEIRGPRDVPLAVQYSADDGQSWHTATIYVGARADAWRTCDAVRWNHGATDGQIPPGQEPCVWDYWFDLDMPRDHAELRLLDYASNKLICRQTIDLRGTGDVFVIDRRNVARLAGGSLPRPWTLRSEGKKLPTVESLSVRLTKKEIVGGRYPIYQIDEASVSPLVLSPKLKGWHRIYLGMEAYGSLQFWLSTEQIKYPIPEYHMPPSVPKPQLLQDLYIKSADLSGQDVCLACGGARYWRDVSVRYVRFVPMADDEVAHFKRVRELARTEGRPFAGYVEPCTPCHYEPASLTLVDHVRNEMRLNRVRGCTDVYVHAIRAGSKAWYHSDVVERHLPKDEHGPHGPAAKWSAWMAQGDPMAVAVVEGRAAGLKVFADLGMNISYKGEMRERTIREHPDYLCKKDGQFLDYRKPPVRDYVVAIATELLTKYDVDGVHLDFARFASNRAFDEPSLVEVMHRIHDVRRAAETKRGHCILIATRIPSYRYHERNGADYRGDFPEFVSALSMWSRSGWINRVMACSMGRAGYLKGLSLTRYKAAIAGTNAKLWGDLYGGGAFARTRRSIWLDVARKWVAEGLDGGFFFYAEDRPTEFEQIAWQLRLIDFPDVSVEPADR